MRGPAPGLRIIGSEINVGDDMFRFMHQLHQLHIRPTNPQKGMFLCSAGT